MPDATARAIISTEARSLAALHHVAALHRGKPRAAASALVDVVTASRAAGRRAGAQTMAAEVGRPLPVLSDPGEVDRLHAERAVSGYLKALDVAGQKKTAGERISVPQIIASKLDLIAATEVPAAFSEERERIERRVVRDNPMLVPALLKVWNAYLDACPVCRGLHRTSRPWGVDFEGKQPGRAHFRCRCYSTYLPIPVTAMGSLRTQERRAGGAWEWVEL